MLLALRGGAMLKKHVFVCVQNRPVGHPRGSCQSKGSRLVYEAFAAELTRPELWGDLRLSVTGRLGPCAHGASVVVYPDGVLYGQVDPSDVSAIVEEHLLANRPVTRLAVNSW